MHDAKENREKTMATKSCDFICFIDFVALFDCCACQGLGLCPSIPSSPLFQYLILAPYFAIFSQQGLDE